MAFSKILIKKLLYSLNNVEGEMKKSLLFVTTILFLIILISCGQDNSIIEPDNENVIGKNTNNNSLNGRIEIRGEPYNDLAIYDNANNLVGNISFSANNELHAKANKDLFLSANELLSLGADIVSINSGGVISLNSGLIINENGALISVGGILANTCKGSAIISNGNEFHSESVGRWRGELNSDPVDGISGDRYYNLENGKEKLYIESKKVWINR